MFGALSRPIFVIYDFVCPYSHIVQYEVDRLVEEFEIVPSTWRPHWLHPDVPEEGRPFPPELDDARRSAVMQWTTDMSPAMGPAMRMPDRQQYSLTAFAAMEFAKDGEVEATFRRTVFRALWNDGRDIGQPGTIHDLLREVGLDPAGFERGGADGSYRMRALRAAQNSRKLGLTTTPTVIVGRTAVTGWHYYEVYERLLEDQGVPRR